MTAPLMSSPSGGHVLCPHTELIRSSTGRRKVVNGTLHTFHKCALPIAHSTPHHRCFCGCPFGPLTPA